MQIFNVIKKSILAGMFIGIAGFEYLTNQTVIGAILFSFGLVGIIHYQLNLFTGMAGFVGWKEIPVLIPVLINNIIGCFIIALIVHCSSLPVQDVAQAILFKRLELGLLNGFLLSVLCGFIMTTAVTFARRDQYLPLLFGVPVFIICGFPHCIADIFYYLCVPISLWSEHLSEILSFYGIIVLGNFVGCNIPTKVLR